MTGHMTRRGALAALVAIPSLSVVAPVDAAELPWERRQHHVEALARITRAFNEAFERLPGWARDGERFMLTAERREEYERLSRELRFADFDEFIQAECCEIWTAEDAIADLPPSQPDGGAYLGPPQSGLRQGLHCHGKRVLRHYGGSPCRAGGAAANSVRHHPRPRCVLCRQHQYAIL